MYCAGHRVIKATLCFGGEIFILNEFENAYEILNADQLKKWMDARNTNGVPSAESRF